MTRKEVINFAIGPIGGAALGLVTLPLTAWFFPPEDIGRLAMLQVAITFCLLVFSLGLDQAYVREYHSAPNKQWLFKATTLPGLLLLLVVLLTSLLIDPRTLSEALFSNRSGLEGLLVSVAIIAAYVSRHVSLVLRMQERGIAFSLAQILPKLLFLALVAYLIVSSSEANFLYLLAAYVVSVLVVAVTFGWFTRKYWFGSTAHTPTIFSGEILPLLNYGLPLILGGLAYWGLTFTDRISLRTFSTLQQLGVYSIAASFAGVAAILQSIFSTVWAPTIYKWINEEKDLTELDKITESILVIVLLLFCITGTLSWILDFVLPSSYIEVKYVVVSCIAYPLLYTLSETTVVGINIAKKTTYAMTASMIAFFFNVAGNLLLVPQFGAAGAAVSTCIAFWIFLVVRTEFSNKVWRPIRRTKLYSLTFIVVVASIITTLWGSKLGVIIQSWWLGLLIAILLSNKNTISYFLRFAFR